MENMKNSNENPTSDAIKPIDRQTVHRICSGQVVLSLAIAVKELIENAIDASATNIEIRLREYGLDLIEVLDNGIGVKEDNFKSLTLKHYTSKIQQFDDLESVNTMGFRGEALSSLCALCDLTVITKHKTADYATKIKYDHNGLIENQMPSARCQGTTVILTNLFSTLPVRRKEYVKNLKREFNKMCQLLYAYCLVCKNVRISCTNTTNRGSKNIVVTTQGLNSIRDNIISIFGAKQISSLIDVNLMEPNDDILNEYNLNQSEIVENNFNFDFFISSAQHGSGRSTADRQFYFINNRPCEAGKIAKLVNETYRQFNCNQYPFVYLNLILTKSEIDVNVTPDKRQIYLQREKLILAYVKASLLTSFKHLPSTYECQNLNATKSILRNESILEHDERNVKRKQDDDNEVSVLEAFKNKFQNDGQRMLHDNKKLKIENNSSSLKAKIEHRDVLKQIKLNEVKDFKLEHNDTNEDNSNKKLDSLIEMMCEKDEEENLDASQASEENVIEQTCKETTYKQFSNITDEKIEEVKLTCKYVKENKVAQKIMKAVVKNAKNSQCTPRTRNVINWNISLDDIVKQIDSKQSSHNDSLRTSVKFKSKILPNCNKEAEQELQKHFNKDSFKEMEVIGQFNLAFIIAKLKNDLFIVDQHASDEKFNFEQLGQTTILENQKLVNPKALELTAGNESLLIDNIELFNKNGFEFDIKDEAEATKKVYLKAIPISKNYIFGKDDIDEMLFMLKDSNITSCRPSKVRSILASRACRKSVMVGRHLAKNEMKKILNHMGDIEQPWVNYFVEYKKQLGTGFVISSFLVGF